LIGWALEEHMRPTAMILRKNPHKKWNEYDHLLMQAYKQARAEDCPNCGLPRYLCNNGANDIQFKTEKFDCKASQAIEKAKKRDYGDDGPPADIQYVATPYSTTGRPLVDYRYEYYKDQMVQREKLAALEQV
jgi:hypothetical protein